MSSERSNDLVLISGGGIGGLCMALTLHQIGMPCLVFETVSEIKPLGVGINLQPNAVRELYELGFTEEVLDTIGVQAKEWALVGRNGHDIYSEERGLLAGYHWPQYAIHRGQLQTLLYQTVLERLGPDSIKLGSKITGYRNNDQGVTVIVQNKSGQYSEVNGSLLIGADGINSAVREQMYPDQPSPHWGGAIMWRGTSMGVPVRSGASFVGLGSSDHRLVFYPISKPDSKTGLATINWIAEIKVDNSDGWSQGDWNRQIDVEEFIEHFEDWNFDWLDVPAMLRGAENIFEYPMIDRDPIPSWVDGTVGLIGDAAHVMYPVGSNGASQAIVDTRVLGASIEIHGATEYALKAYNEQLCEPVSALVLRNRGSGPFEILAIIEERCGGDFEDINDVISKAEREEFMARYKTAAGFAKDKLNSAKSILMSQNT